MSANTSVARPFPVAEMITRDVLDTLAGVRRTAGYNVDLSVQRYRPQGNDARHLLAVVEPMDPTELGDVETDCGSKAWVRPYAAQIYVFASELHDPDHYGQTVEQARADAERALMADVTRGGWATNTEVRSPTEFGSPTDASGIIVFFEVTYRHNERDPYDRVQSGAP